MARARDSASSHLGSSGPLLLAALFLTAFFPGCSGANLVLTEQIEARQHVADLRVQFTKTAAASNRAVMADTDDASAEAAREAVAAREKVDADLAVLRTRLSDLGYSSEIESLQNFTTHFAQYKTLDDEILGLAVENTNLKAQRLSFGGAQQASDALRDALSAMSRAASPGDRQRIEVLAGRARVAVLEIQVLHARHIAESADAAMTTMEATMKADEESARAALVELKSFAPKVAAASVIDAIAALDRFKTATDEIIRLSRRNSNVRSLALSMERQRTVTSRCEVALQALDDALSSHEFKATR